MRGATIRHEGHHEAVQSVTNAVRFDEDRRIKLSKSESERTLLYKISFAQLSGSPCGEISKTVVDILTDQTYGSSLDLQGLY